MSYTRTTWVSGETPLSAANMNNIEDGIEENKSDITDLNSNLTALNNEIEKVDDVSTITLKNGVVLYLNKRLRIGIINIYSASNYVSADIKDSSGNRIYPKTNFIGYAKYYPGSGSNTPGYLLAKTNGTVVLCSISDDSSTAHSYVFGSVTFFY